MFVIIYNRMFTCTFTAYIDEYCWRRNIERSESFSPDDSRETRIFESIIAAINTHFPLNNSRVEKTDKYANIYNYDESDENWLHEPEEEGEDFDVELREDQEELEAELEDILAGIYCYKERSLLIKLIKL
jgi:hypothetical protein